MLVTGGQSELIGAEHADEFLKLAPHAEHTEVPDAAHMVAGDANDRFPQRHRAISQASGRQRRPSLMMILFFYCHTGRRWPGLRLLQDTDRGLDRCYRRRIAGIFAGGRA